MQGFASFSLHTAVETLLFGLALDSDLLRLIPMPILSHSIPEKSLVQTYITELPGEVLSTPFGQMIAPGLGGMQGRLNSTQQGTAQESVQQQTPFKAPTGDVTAAVTDSLRWLSCTHMPACSLVLQTICSYDLAIGLRCPGTKENGALGNETARDLSSH